MEIRLPASEYGHESYFIEQDGIRFSGVHLLIDMWGGVGLDDIGAVERILREVVQACGATLLGVVLGKLPPGARSRSCVGLPSRVVQGATQAAHPLRHEARAEGDRPW